MTQATNAATDTAICWRRRTLRVCRKPITASVKTTKMPQRKPRSTSPENAEEGRVDREEVQADQGVGTYLRIWV